MVRNQDQSPDMLTPSINSIVALEGKVEADPQAITKALQLEESRRVREAGIAVMVADAKTELKAAIAELDGEIKPLRAERDAISEDRGKAVAAFAKEHSKPSLPAAFAKAVETLGCRTSFNAPEHRVFHEEGTILLTISVDFESLGKDDEEDFDGAVVSPEWHISGRGLRGSSAILRRVYSLPSRIKQMTAALADINTALAGLERERAELQVQLQGVGEMKDALLVEAAKKDLTDRGVADLYKSFSGKVLAGTALDKFRTRSKTNRKRV